MLAYGMATASANGDAWSGRLGFVLAAIGLPVLLAEFVLGSRARGDLLEAFSHPRAWLALLRCVAPVAMLVFLATLALA
jgi:SNF family Na+-dependent transporter